MQAGLCPGSPNPERPGGLGGWVCKRDMEEEEKPEKSVPEQEEHQEMKLEPEVGAGAG